VVKSEAFLLLEDLYRKSDVIYIWDFDGYNSVAEGLNMAQVFVSD
jgi:hypothetical protein